jgi:hypothetical protein
MVGSLMSASPVLVPQSMLGTGVRSSFGSGVLQTIGIVGRVINFQFLVSLIGMTGSKMVWYVTLPSPPGMSPSLNAKSNSVNNAHTSDIGFASAFPTAAASC